MLALVENHLLPPITRLAEMKHLRAIRDGIVAILPLIIIASFFLLLGQLPVDAISSATLDAHPTLSRAVHWYLGGAGEPGFQATLLIPFRLIMFLMALFAAFGIAYYLARSYKLDGISAGILSATAMVLSQQPHFIAGDALAANRGWVMVLKSMAGRSNLGGQGLLAAILVAFFTVEVIRFCEGRKWRFAMPEGVPESVTRALAALVPAVIVFTSMWLVADCLGIDIVGVILTIFHPLIWLGDTIWAVLIINLVMQIIWLGGIHGASVVNAVFLTIWMGYFEENAAAAAAGQVLPHITTLPFYQWFVWIGGSGATLTLVFMMCLSRSSFIRRIGKISLFPGICNINEPVIFGLPIMMNPRMAIPFILAPMITGVVSYLVIGAGLVRGLSVMPPWTLPAPVGAFFATGFDPRAVVLVLVNMILTGLIYWPFFRSYEKQMLRDESGADRPQPDQEG